MNSKTNALNSGFNGYSATKTAAANTVVSLQTITLQKGLWLLSSFMTLREASSGVYNHVLDAQTVRSASNNGGGSMNIYLKYCNSPTNINVGAYLPSNNTIVNFVQVLKLRD